MQLHGDAGTQRIWPTRTSPQAFDQCAVENVIRGLGHAAVPAYVQYAFLDPLCDSVGKVCHEGIEVEGVSWDVCIRAGGPEGPPLLSILSCPPCGEKLSGIGVVVN